MTLIYLSNILKYINKYKISNYTATVQPVQPRFFSRTHAREEKLNTVGFTVAFLDKTLKKLDILRNSSRTQRVTLKNGLR